MNKQKGGIPLIPAIPFPGRVIGVPPVAVVRPPSPVIIAKPAPIIVPPVAVVRPPSPVILARPNPLIASPIAIILKKYPYDLFNQWRARGAFRRVNTIWYYRSLDGTFLKAGTLPEAMKKLDRLYGSPEQLSECKKNQDKINNYVNRRKLKRNTEKEVWEYVDKEDKIQTTNTIEKALQKLDEMYN